ncbi:Kdo domain containing protein [Flavobacterium sp. LMO8]|uniref:Kdo domain containing protein n=1 Tax=Flavobacterium sp. LMO8 TaxID=2654244 RepID=UPI00129204CD|nr:Kdo domain containing protein [Flavobacterium sp. LMO8]MQP24100.1 Kdo domain containing protein [Flavobacterium sp. LMO8]
MKSIFNPDFEKRNEVVYNCIVNYYRQGTFIYEGNRNSLKIFEIDNLTICVKAFKKPHIFNKIIYTYFRKSKAKRSFEFANILLQKGIGTPIPIAYYENFDTIGLNESYYVCEFLKTDFRFRELLDIDDEVKKTAILKQFVAFTYKLHQSNIEFIDHSSGNTLIKDLGDGNYDFYLVDLNRTNFNKKMTFIERMNNFSKLTSRKDIVQIMSEEYAKLSGENNELVFDEMWNATQKFQQQHFRKKRLKKKLKFWKK